MIAVIINAAVIVLGGFVGLLLKKGIKESYKETIMKGMSLAIIVIGISGAMESNNMLVVLASIVIGSIMGEFISIEERLETYANKMESRFAAKDSNFTKGFVTSTLVYCVGAMAIVGSLKSGLTGNHEVLYTKSVLDGVSSVIFASTFGVGVLFSAIPVLLYQGFITLTASVGSEVLTDIVVMDMSAVGSLLIMGIGFNVLGITKIRVGNMLPAIFIPIIYYQILGVIG